jgi:2-dehydropantoate 2-reductase
MKVCVFGVGAVGGQVVARLAAAGTSEISVVARGAQLDAIRRRGAILRTEGKEIVGRPARATDNPAELPPQDLVAVALKATALPAAAESIAGLLAPDGCAVFLNNGIPWWWTHGLNGVGTSLPLIDPEGVVWKHVRPERALGCVVYSPNEVIEPGVTLHVGGNRWVMGEPDRSMSDRLKRTVQLFSDAGLKAEAAADIRREVWLKLVRNAPSNSLSALTRRGLSETTADPGLQQIAARVMRETLAVAAALGWDLQSEVNPDQVASRGGGSKGGLRISMLQDVLRGRPLEVEVQLGQVQAFARENGVQTPTIDTLVPLMRGLDRTLRESHVT